MPSYLPAPKEIRDLLSDLLDREITLSPSAPLAPTALNPCTIGVYVDDLLQVTALVGFDLALSAHAAAAIGLVPSRTAQEEIDAGILGDALRENLHEVFNVTASLFNVEGATHVRLYSVNHAGVALPPDVLARSLTLGRREDLAVDIAGYGAGRLSVVLV